VETAGMIKKRIISIQDTKSESLLASAIENERVLLFEGAWYFDMQAVDMAHLVVTDRTYVCPYKGTCYWIDLDAPDHQSKNVAFTYFETNPGYEFVQDKIGFYAGRRQDTVQTAELISNVSTG